jgi:hypothetical protein
MFRIIETKPMYYGFIDKNVEFKSGLIGQLLLCGDNLVINPSSNETDDKDIEK